MSVVTFKDGSVEFIRNMGDVSRILEERLGQEPAEAILAVMKRSAAEKVMYEVDAARAAFGCSRTGR